jgi:hypothetical protein
VVEVNVAVELPVPYRTYVGLKDTLRPLLGDTVAEKSTWLLKPFCEFKVIVDVLELPDTKLAGVVEVTLKLGVMTAFTLNVTVACEGATVPLIPVTLTVFGPAVVNVHERLVVPDVVTVVGFKEHALLSTERLTLPVKPLRGVIVIAEVLAVFTLVVMVVGFA